MVIRMCTTAVFLSVMILFCKCNSYQCTRLIKEDFKATKAIISFRYTFQKDGVGKEVFKYLVIENDSAIAELSRVIGKRKGRICTCGHCCIIDFFQRDQIIYRLNLAQNHSEHFQAATIYPENDKERYFECSINENGKKLLDKYLKMTTDYGIVTGDDTLYLDRKLSFDSKEND